MTATRIATILTGMLVVTAAAAIYVTGVGFDTIKPSKQDVYRMCTAAATEYLKAPATAQWPEYGDGTMVVSAEDPRELRAIAGRGTNVDGPDIAGMWLVTTDVDSENSFGALINSDVSCLFTSDDYSFTAETIMIGGELAYINIEN